MFGNHVSGRLYAFREDRLSDTERRVVEGHLAACDRCRGELEGIDRAVRMMSGLPLVEAPEVMWPLPEVRTRPGLRQRLKPALAVAVCALVLIAAGAWWRARQSRPGWEVAIEGRGGTGVIRVRDWLDTGSSRARIKVGEIGEVDVEPNTRIQLLDARTNDHRLALARGTMHARIWAPPRLFFVETPSGRAVDLGCVYTLQVDEKGAGLLRVTLGWVMLEDKGRQALAPAGAACRMRPDVGPGTPYFEDASKALQSALMSFDFESGGSAALKTVAAEARKRDTLTLWHLLSRVGPDERPTVYDRMAALVPPPPGLSRDDVLRLDGAALATYKSEIEWAW